MKNHPQTTKVGFLKTGHRKPSFRFLNFEVGLVRLLENRYPTFSFGSAPPRGDPAEPGSDSEKMRLLNEN